MKTGVAQGTLERTFTVRPRIRVRAWHAVLDRLPLWEAFHEIGPTTTTENMDGRASMSVSEPVSLRRIFGEALACTCGRSRPQD